MRSVRQKCDYKQGKLLGAVDLTFGKCLLQGHTNVRTGTLAKNKNGALKGAVTVFREIQSP
jgi:hypothetical protein